MDRTRLHAVAQDIPLVPVDRKSFAAGIRVAVQAIERARLETSAEGLARAIADTCRQLNERASNEEQLSLRTPGAGTRHIL